MLFGDPENRVKVEVFTDSKPLVDTISSTKIVENRALIPEVNSMKEMLETKTVKSFTWVESSDQLADPLTKEMTEPCAMRDLFLRNRFDHKKFSKNPQATIIGYMMKEQQWKLLKLS